MFRVIAQYLGYSPELEEELYFATRRRPDQAGQQPHTPAPDIHEPDVEGGIHHPKEVHQHYRFLSYRAADPAEAAVLADKLGSVGGVSVKIIDDRKPAAEAPAEPAAQTETPAEESAPIPEGDAAHADAD